MRTSAKRNDSSRRSIRSRGGLKIERELSLLLCDEIPHRDVERDAALEIRGREFEHVQIGKRVVPARDRMNEAAFGEVAQVVFAQDGVHPAEIARRVILPPQCFGVGKAGGAAEFIFGHDESGPSRAVAGQDAAESGDERPGVAPCEQG